MTSLPQKKQRIEWIDCAKGIGILLVIIAHTLPVHGSIVREAISSFHMPLFFILSSLTIQYSRNFHELLNRCYRSFKHLILPMIIMWGICLVVDFFQLLPELRSIPKFAAFFGKRILTLLYANGNPITINVMGGGDNYRRNWGNMVPCGSVCKQINI